MSYVCNTDDSEDEVFIGRIGEKEKQIYLNEFKQFGRKYGEFKYDTDVKCDATVQVVDLPKDVGIFIENNNETVKDEVEVLTDVSSDSEVQLADFPKDDEIIIINNSRTAEDEMRDVTSDSIVQLMNLPQDIGVFNGINSEKAEHLVQDSSSEVIVIDLRTSTEELYEGLSPTNTKDKTLNTNFENSCLVDKPDANKCLQDQNCKFENSFGDGMNRWNVSESENSETNLNSTLENVENLLAQGIKFMLTDDNGVDISHFLPDGCDIFDSNKEKPHHEESKMTGLASSDPTIEDKQQNIELLNTDIFKCHEVDSFTSNSEHSESNLNDTLENVENLLSHGMKYMLTDDNGVDISHLLPDGCGIYDVDKKASHDEDPKLSNSVNGNDRFIIPDMECGKAKSERPILRPQNKCGSVIREYIDVNPPQLISNVKAKHITKVGNIVKAKQMGVMKRRIVSSEGRLHYRTRKPAASSVKSNIDSPLPAVDYTSTVGLMLKNFSACCKVGSDPVVTKHIGRIRLPSQFRSNTTINNDEVSILVSTPVKRLKTLKPRQIWK